MPVVDGVDSCGAPLAAQTLYGTLLQGESFPQPTVNLTDADYQIPNVVIPAPAQITLAALTTKEVNGPGVFDTLMGAMAAHLEVQRRTNAITGREYAETYIAGTNAALQAAIQFLLNRDTSYYQALQAQAQAQSAQAEVVTARIGAQTAKAQFSLALANLGTMKAEFAAKKLQLANLEAEHCNLLLQKRGLLADAGTKEYILTNRLPRDLALINEQVIGVQRDNDIKQYTRDNILVREADLKHEQWQTQRAQTLDTRSDGGTVVGVLGKQKDLYTQQIASYRRDAEAKVAKMFLDCWTVQKTVDEGLTAPTAFQNTNINNVFSTLKTNAGL